MSSDPLKLRVRNFLGIQRADVDFGGIVLVAGINGAGKSSLCEAAACAITASPLARGQTTKKAAAEHLVREGTDKGSIALDYGPGTIRLSYPDCMIEQSGKPAMLGTALGIGSAKFMALTPSERTRQIGERFETKPVIADLRAWSAEHPEAGLRTDELIAALWDGIDVQGWDAMHKAAHEHGTRLKGRWEAVTSLSWGSKIASQWCPSPLLPGEEYDLGAARAAEAKAAGRLEELLGHAAVTAADIERLERDAGCLEEAKRDFDVARNEGRRIAKEIEKLVVKRDSEDAPIDTSKLQGCPHCGGKIRIISDKHEKYVFLEAAPAPLPAAEAEAARIAAEAIEEKIAALKREAAENSKLAVALAASIKTREQARRELSEARSKPQVAQEEVAAARQRSVDAKRRADAVHAMQAAGAIYEDWCHQAVLIEGLAPNGIRRAVMVRKLSALNAMLGEFCAVAKFADVTLTDDMDCHYDGRPYALLSESERWRSDLVLSCLLAQREQARLIVVDRFDVLNPQARPGVLFLLRHVGIPALVCMTAKDQTTVPSLEKAGLGTARWLDRGTLT